MHHYPISKCVSDVAGERIVVVNAVRIRRTDVTYIPPISEVAKMILIAEPHLITRGAVMFFDLDEDTLVLSNVGIKFCVEVQASVVADVKELVVGERNPNALVPVLSLMLPWYETLISMALPASSPPAKHILFNGTVHCCCTCLIV